MLQLQTMAAEGHRVNCVAFSPDGKTLVTGGSDGHVMWCDVRSGECEGDMSLDTPPRKHGEAFGHSMVLDCSVSTFRWHRSGGSWKLAS